jgi:hypothetical protein
MLLGIILLCLQYIAAFARFFELAALCYAAGHHFVAPALHSCFARFFESAALRYAARHHLLHLHCIATLLDSLNWPHYTMLLGIILLHLHCIAALLNSLNRPHYATLLGVILLHFCIALLALRFCLRFGACALVLALHSGFAFLVCSIVHIHVSCSLIWFAGNLVRWLLCWPLSFQLHYCCHYIGWRIVQPHSPVLLASDVWLAILTADCFSCHWRRSVRMVFLNTCL